MLLATTPIIEGKRITTYYGIVSGETIIGANVFRDFFASIRDIVGGRSGSYEEVLREAKDTALKEMSEQARQMGANAVIGVDLDYETVGGSGRINPLRPISISLKASQVFVRPASGCRATTISSPRCTARYRMRVSPRRSACLLVSNGKSCCWIARCLACRTVS